MLRHISKNVTAGVLAVALALTTLTASTTPAAANGHRNNSGAEAAAVLGGLLLLYGIANANNGRGNVTIQRNHPGSGGWGGNPGHHGWGGHNGYRNLRVAPAHCFVQGPNFRGYARRCMQQSVAAPHLLPSHCIRNIHTHHGPGQIYGGRCLSNNGWTRG